MTDRVCLWVECRSHFSSFLLNHIHFCTGLRQSGFSYSGRRKYSEVERVTEKNEKREHEKREGALGRARK